MLFQHTAARRRLGYAGSLLHGVPYVSTHSRPKAAGPSARFRAYARPFQHTAARRRLEHHKNFGLAYARFQHTAARRRLEKNHQKYACHCCFNTQPPEGGWDLFLIKPIHHLGFNTQPPEGGWVYNDPILLIGKVSTHSRPKAAG